MCILTIYIPSHRARDGPAEIGYMEMTPVSSRILAGYLRVAAEQFEKDATEAASNPGLVRQFECQATDCRTIAEALEAGERMYLTD